MQIDFKNLPGNSTISPLPSGADAVVLCQIAENSKQPVLYITLDDKRADEIIHEIKFFAPSIETITIPAWDCLPYDRVSPAAYITSKRTESLCEIAAYKYKKPSAKPTIIVTTINAVLQKIPLASNLAEVTLIARRNEKLDRDKLIKFLVKSGYINSATANEAGEFAVRGSILDIIPSGSEKGYRLDFFSDTLDTIRDFDPLTQISGNKQHEIKIMPASEITMDSESIELFRKNYRKLFGTVAGDDPLYDAISEGRHYAGMEHWLPLFYENMETIFDFLPDSIICLENHINEARHERIEVIDDYYKSRIELKESSYKPIPPEMLYLNNNDWDRLVSKRKIISFSPFKVEDKEIAPTNYSNVPNFALDSKNTKIHAFELLRNYITPEHGKRLKAIIACYSEGSRERLKNMLTEHGFHVFNADSWQDARTVKGKSLCLIVLPLEKGFADNEYAIISEQDLLGERIGHATKSRKKSDQFMMEASSLTEGELVVHKEHGLGRFEALETIEVSGQKHDCLRIIYQGGDKLYVPVENIDTLSRYGSEEETTKLDKLGSSSWQARKSKLKQRIKEIAADLIKIAAERLLKKAPNMAPMQGLYEEFCSRFPYPETDDQLRCIADVIDDLQSGKPMDRLICGDVGFGKTEIALRAAFIGASDEKHMQVAVITPTTLLCRQHAETFKKRFAGMPFEVRDLSRLTPPKAAKETKIGIKEGKVDIVIGTHALLAKSIEFKKLGMVIIDEEQLFGVVQKERFKQLRSDIHVLSLSATPIPRTLQMSLTGIKDLSIIATPPVDRLSIRTFTMPFDQVVIRNAILREYYRGGKIFFVVPRIKDLDEISGKIRKLVPEIKITQAHGQLPPAELDRIMTEFCDGKHDMLIATNIIGSGIDLPSANTIIIHRADMFGLAQLYQMRGRVGRGKIRAYAYLTTNPRKVPGKIAQKRLEVMQSLDSLGAGFSLASHDMDIRGFGNLLGDEQSGQIREVGVELYQTMLEEAIANAKSQSSGSDIDDSEHFSPNINLGLTVLIPDDYVTDIELRLGLYRRIANLQTETEIEGIAAEMIDRFGALPEAAHNLLEVMKIKLMCIKANIEKIDAGSKGVVITFRNNKFSNPEGLIEFISKNKLTTKLRGDHKLVLLQEWKTIHERLAGTKKSLDKIISIAA